MATERSGLRRRLGRIAGNVGLLAFSLVLSYVLAAALFLSFGPPLLPELQNYFPVAARIWWQPSAPDPSGTPYIALIGDSYAQGIGDWRASIRNVDEPSHSADVIAQVTGRPVLSFGSSGAGTAEAVVQEFTRGMGADRCLIFGKPRRPEQIVVYFYEGNDLRDNIEFVTEMLGTSPDDPQLGARMERYFRDVLSQHGLGLCLGYFATSLDAMTEALTATIEVDEDDPDNVVLLNGKPTTIRGYLEGPGVEFDASHTAAALLVTEKSMQWLRAQMPELRVTLVHLPSVLTSYRHAGAEVMVEIDDGSDRPWPAAAIAVRSDEICERLAAIASKVGIGFLDSRPALRALATTTLIHGPRDYRHFNRAGYTRLGETVAAALAGTAQPQGCAKLAETAP